MDWRNGALLARRADVKTRRRQGLERALAVGLGGVCLIGLAACGGTTASQASKTAEGGASFDAAPDGGISADTDGGATSEGGTTEAGGSQADAPATVYPAFDPDLPQVASQGGPVLKNPVLVTVTWAGDPNAAFYEAFGDTLGSSQYWATAESEYAIGPASSGAANHVSIATPAPSSMNTDDFVNLIEQSVAASDGGAPGAWPPPTPNTMYLVYPPVSTTLVLEGEPFCGGAYHDSIPIGSGNVAYAVMGSCAGGTSGTTLSASHEIGEGSADPYPSVVPAYLGFDQAHFAWDVMQSYQDEIADACEFYTSSTYYDTEPGFSYTVQRIWSDKNAMAGHNPCQPADTPVYYNTTLVAPEDITVDDHENGGSTKMATKGIGILPGQTKTFPIGFYSDGPTPGPWTIIVHDTNPLAGLGDRNNGQFSATLDKTTGQNGDIANLTVTVTTAGDLNSELIVVESRLGVQPSHFYPVLIGSQ